MAIQWPVECDEQWSYQADYSTVSGVVRFEGLQALCPGCHQVCHFGKARVDGKDDSAMARLMVINSWSIQKAEHFVNQVFDEWEKMSSVTKWSFDFSVLKAKYSISIEKIAEDTVTEKAK